MVKRIKRINSGRNVIHFNPRKACMLGGKTSAMANDKKITEFYYQTKESGCIKQQKR